MPMLWSGQLMTLSKWAPIGYRMDEKKDGDQAGIFTYGEQYMLMAGEIFPFTVRGRQGLQSFSPVATVEPDITLTICML